MASIDATEPWAWLQHVVLLGWLGLLCPSLLLLWRHLERNAGKKLSPRGEPEGATTAGRRMAAGEWQGAGASVKLTEKSQGKAEPRNTDGPRRQPAIAAKTAPLPPQWFSLFGCCTSRGAAVEPALEDAKRPPRRPWRAEEVAEAGVPEEVVGEITRLAGLVGAGSVEPLSDPLTLWRFYRAREGDVEVAAAMYRASLTWRSSFSIPEVMAAHGSGEEYQANGARASENDTSWSWQRTADTPEAAFVARHGFFGRLKRLAPADGAPVAVWRNVVDVEGIAREGLIHVLERGFVAHLEDLLQTGRAASRRRNSVVRCRLIIDIQDMSMGSLLRRVKFVKNLLTLGKAYFPEVNASVTVVRAPKVVAQLWAVVKPLLTPTMRAKVCILGDDFEAGLREHSGLERSALPAVLGGQASDDEICACLPVPKGVGATLKSVLNSQR